MLYKVTMPLCANSSPRNSLSVATIGNGRGHGQLYGCLNDGVMYNNQGTKLQVFKNLKYRFLDMDHKISLEVDETLPPVQECSGDNEVNSVTSHSEESRQISSSGSRNNSSNDPSSIATIHESHPSDVSNINENNSENFKQNDAFNVNNNENLSFGGNGHEDVSDNENKVNSSNEDGSSDEKNEENVCMDGGTTDKNVSSNNRNEDGNISSDDGDDDENGGTDDSAEDMDCYPFSEGELDPMPVLKSTSEESGTVENLETNRAVQEQGVVENNNTVDNISSSPPKDGSDSQQKNSASSLSDFPLIESEESENIVRVSGMPQSMDFQCPFCSVMMPSNAGVCSTCGFSSGFNDGERQLLHRMEEEQAIMESLREFKSKPVSDEKD